VFDRVVAFTTCTWLGTAEANPTDAPLPWPADLFSVRRSAAA